MLETPILFLVFNRPDTTRSVFESIRQAKPKKLFVAADGPREDCEDEKDKCARVREIATQVDWPCQVVTLFRDTNLGCGLAVSQAITWFFEQVEEGIILEDDTLPDQSFFKFCAELLNYYRWEEKVMMISGFNGIGRYQHPNSYSFQRGGGIWGWATWRRAWLLNDYGMQKYPSFKASILSSATAEVKEKLDLYDKVIGANLIDTWDIQWNFAIDYHTAYCIWPHINMVKNVGFGPDATHTKQQYAPGAFLKKYQIVFPLVHPTAIEANQDLLNEYKTNFIQADMRPMHIKIKEKAKNKIRKMFSNKSSFVFF